MTPAERTAKVAELRAEADRLEKGWPDKIERGMVFQQMATKEVYIMSGRNRLVCVTDGGEWSGDQGFSNRENDFTYLGHARDLGVPDAGACGDADGVVWQSFRRDHTWAALMI